MKSHLDNLLEIVPDLNSRYVLDLGSGKGRFLMDLARKNVRCLGIELNQRYIDISYAEAQKSDLLINVDKGVGEDIKYVDDTFDFVNICEVIEHVDDPVKTLREAYRVLKPSGLVYLSAPNRFGLKDQHFGLYFVNWLPRSWSEVFVSFFNKQKDYNDVAGFQKLDQMHYYTYYQITRLVKEIGFGCEDIREKKINKMYKNIFIRTLILFAYRILKLFYFDSFHLLLIKR